MKLFELFELQEYVKSDQKMFKNWPKSFWYNPQQNQIIDIKNIDHSNVVIMSGDTTFNISKNDHMWNILQDRYPNESSLPGWDDDAIKLANKYGWVRMGQEFNSNDGTMFFQTTVEDDLIKAIRDVNKSWNLTIAYVDLLAEDYLLNGFIALKGQELNYFIKYKRFMPRKNKSKISQFREAINENKMTYNSMAMGLSQYQNNKIALVGGFRSGSSPANSTRLKYDIYNLEVYKNGNEKEANIGYVELFVSNDNKIIGLVDIKLNVKNRKKGFGEFIVQSIINTAPGNLIINDIKKNARKFWENFNIEYTSISKHTGVIYKK